MTFISFMVLALLPALLFYIICIKLGKDYKLLWFYLIEFIIVGILGAIVHFYYYQTYDLAVLPSMGTMKTAFIISTSVMALMYFYDLLFDRDKEEEKTSLALVGITLVMILFFIIWFIPVGQKYNFVHVLEKVEETFDDKVPGKIVRKEHITIGLVASNRDRTIRGRYQRSQTRYKNYLYIENTDEIEGTIDIYLTLLDENNQILENEHLTDILVDGNSTELLLVNKSKLVNNAWEESSISTKKQVRSLEAVLVIW